MSMFCTIRPAVNSVTFETHDRPETRLLIRGRTSGKHAETRTLVTSRTIGKIVCTVAAERSPAVMTSSAADATDRIVFVGDRICHLATLRHSGAHCMAFITAYTLSRAVIIMAENGTEEVSRRRRSPVWCQRMTSITRTDRSIRRVACVTIAMCLYTDRDRFAGTCRQMA